jgi:hypothetical protein
VWVRVVGEVPKKSPSLSDRSLSQANSSHFGGIPLMTLATQCVGKRGDISPK